MTPPAGDRLALGGLLAHDDPRRIAAQRRSSLELDDSPPLTAYEEPSPNRTTDDDGPTSWEPIDLAAVLAGVTVPGPTLWAHKRGHHLLYAGRTHSFQGQSETLKSWAAQGVVAAELQADADVLYVDYEDDEAGVVNRLLALGVPGPAIAAHLVYVRPDEPLIDRQQRYTRAGLRFAELLEERPWRLGVVDGVTEAMTTEGLEVNDNADAARFARRILRPIADTGAAALAIDHVTKNGEAGRHAIGAQHKLSGLTGAAFRFEPLRPLSRAVGADPVVGTVKVVVVKDRPGHVRGHSADGTAGILSVTAWPDGGVDVEIVDAADLGDAGADLELAGRLLDYLTTYEGASKNAIEKDVVGKTDALRAALGWLIGKGWVDVRKEGQAHRHYVTELGRTEASR